MLTSTTTVLHRNERVVCPFGTYPLESSWALLAVFFVKAHAEHSELILQPQISHDGLEWVNDGDPVHLCEPDRLAAVKMKNFGGWIRIKVTSQTVNDPIEITVTATLKG